MHCYGLIEPSFTYAYVLCIYIWHILDQHFFDILNLLVQHIWCRDLKQPRDKRNRKYDWRRRACASFRYVYHRIQSIIIWRLHWTHCCSIVQSLFNSCIDLWISCGKHRCMQQWCWYLYRNINKMWCQRWRQRWPQFF